MERKTNQRFFEPFSNQKIGAKIFTGYMVAFMLAAAVGILAVYQFGQVSANIYLLTGAPARERNLAERIAIQIHLIRLHASQYIYQGQNPDDLKAYNQALGDAQVLMNESDQINTRTDRAGVRAQIRKDFNNFAASFAEIVQLLAARQSTVNNVLTPQSALGAEKLAILRNNSYEILDFTTAHYASQARDMFSQMQVNVIQYLATGNEKYASQVDADYEAVNSTFDLLQDSVHDDASRLLLSEIKTAATIYYQGVQNAQAGIARQHELTAQLDTLGSAIITKSTAIADDINADFTARSQDINTHVKQIQFWTVFMIFMAIIVGMIFDLALSRAITRPIEQLARAAQGIARGSFDQQVEVPGKDELGILAEAFNDMTIRVRETMAALKEDIAERKRAEESLRKSEEKFTKAFRASPTIVVITRAGDGCFIEVNESFEKIMGYTREEALGHTSLELGLFVNPAERERLVPILLANGRLRNQEILYRTKSGEALACLYSGELIELDGEKCLLTTLENITERKRAEERIRNQLEHLNALHNIDNAIKSSADLRITLKVFLDEVTAQLKVDAAAVLLLNRNTLTLDHAASRGFHSAVLKNSTLRTGEGYAGRIVLDGKSIHIPDLAKTENQLTAALARADEKFSAYVGSPLIVKGQVVGVLEIFQRSPFAPDPEWFDFLEILAGQAAIAIDNAQLFESLQRSNFDLTLAYDATIEGWSRAMDLRDHETEGHTQRVTSLSMKLARQMGIPDAEIVHIRRGALLHDIGKMGVPDRILLKSDKLTEDEWEIMRRHATYAYEMLRPIQYLKPALDIPHYHHEKWDGTGYPNGLKGEQIPLAARIFAVVDVWDAVTSDRPYRSGWSKEKTIEYIKSESGKHFDPKVVEIFLPLISSE
jgi:PAS domain S-box-containing protein/putative nucleotidyltransferase with HDIG domain